MKVSPESLSHQSYKIEKPGGRLTAKPVHIQTQDFANVFLFLQTCNAESISENLYELLKPNALP